MGVQKRTNVTKCDFNERGEFVKAFDGLPYAQNYARYGQNVVGVDGAFNKHGNYKSTTMILVGRDGNSSNIVLAVAVCASESGDNCAWFLRCCIKAGIELYDTPIFSDRGSGLLSAIRELPLPKVRFCTRHIYTNVLSQFKGHCLSDIKAIIYRIQSAESKEAYVSYLDTLRLTHEDIPAYLEAIEPENWVKFTTLLAYPLYDWRSTNFVESQNAATSEPRRMLPVGFFTFYMEQFMNDPFFSRAGAQLWLSEGLSVTKYAHEQIKIQQAESAFCALSPSWEHLGFVMDTRRHPVVRRRVNIQQRTSTCSFLDQHGLPYKHFIAALNYKQSNAIFSVVDTCYKTTAYLDLHGLTARAPIELALPEDLEPNLLDMPPKMTKKPGRIKQRRRPSVGDPSRQVGKVLRKAKCRACRQSGHNRRTYTSKYSEDDWWLLHRAVHRVRQLTQAAIVFQRAQEQASLALD